ncbi:TATA-box-binding protein [Haloarcula sp. Atlit-7R]|nr:TATA-box-binding protein [Haloarcula sp. Atlit-7R]
MVEIVNVVGSGSLNVELDLEQVATDMGSIAEYDPNKYPGVYLRFDDKAPLVTLYRTGKYIVTGADSKEEAYVTRERFLTLLADNGIIETPDDEWFRIQNLVCTGELDQPLNLNALAIGLGLEVTEYEPEQFPGLVYRPAEAANVVLLFASGRVVITGSSNLDMAEQTFDLVKKRVTDVLTID